MSPAYSSVVPVKSESTWYFSGGKGLPSGARGPNIVPVGWEDRL